MTVPRVSLKAVTSLLPFVLYAGIASAQGYQPLVTSYVTAAAPADNLSVSPSTVTLSNGAGSGTVKGSSTLSNSGNAATPFTISQTTQTGGSWLSASASTNTISAGGSVPITITANTSQLIPGSYTGTVKITGTDSTATITVNLLVSGIQISTSPNSIALGTIQPQKQPATTVTVTTATGQAAVAIGLAISQGSGWLTTDTAQVTASASGAPFHVTVNASSLSPGPYTGTISLQCTAAPCVSVVVPVTFTVAGADNLSVSPSTVTLSNGAGSGTVKGSSTLSNSGNAATPFTISQATQTGGSWLSASASTNTISAGGSVPITITANTSQLVPGSYTGTVKITGTDSTATITVNLSVSGVQISASPNSIALGTIQPQKQPATTVTVTTAAGQAAVAIGLAISPGFGSGWLTTDTAQVTASTSGAPFHVTVDASSLSPGSYQGQVSLQCTAAPCVEVLIPVTFTVAGADNLSVSPSTVALSNGAGSGTVTGSSTLSNSGSAATPFTISRATQTGGSWLSASASTNTISAGGSVPITITANTSQLVPGSYTGTVKIAGTDSTTTITVNLSVSGVQISVSPNSIALGSIQPQKQPATTVTVTATGTAVVAIGVAIGQGQGSGWLTTDTAQITSGASGATFHVTVDASSLSPGSYQGQVSLQCTAAPCVEVFIPVTFTVAGTDNLSASPSTVTLSNGSGAGTVTGSSTLSNSGSAATPFTISQATQTGGSWLSASASTNTISAGGSVPITITANTSQLVPGSYIGTVKIAGTYSTTTITVNLTVTGVQISASPNPIALGAIQPQKQQPKTVTVTATGTVVVAIGVAISPGQGSGWLTADAPQITASASGATFHVTVDASSLSPGSYQGQVSLQCKSDPCIQVNVPVAFTVPAAGLPAITAVESAAGFQPGVTPGSYVTIMGSNLSSGATGTWNIVNGQLPTETNGVTVSIGGMAAYPYYVSPTQINALAPNAGFGTVSVTVTTPNGTSAPFSVTSTEYSPAFFLWPGNQAVATHLDYSDAAKNGTFSPLATVPAKPNEVIVLWGTGFGPTSPPAPAGAPTPTDQVYSLPTLPVITLNNQPCKVYDAALAGGFAGLYLVAIQVPASTPNGDWPLSALLNGVASPTGAVLTVQQQQ